MEFIDQFEAHYDYNCDYMRDMAKSSPQGFQTFVDFLPMGRYEKSLSKEALWTARLAAMKIEDCGACVQLNIKMALESGVAKEVVKETVLYPEKLNEELKLVFDFAQAVASGSDELGELQRKVSETYNEEERTELALAIAATKIYPTLKRSLGYFKSCSLYEFEF